MNDDERHERAIPEEVLLEVPLPHAGVAARAPHLLANRPFLWMVLGNGFVHLGLWAYWLASEGQAAFQLGATPAELGILLSSYSVSFILGSPGFGVLADRWSPRRLILLAQVGTMAAIVVAVLARSLPWLYGSLALNGAAMGAMWASTGALVPRLVSEDRLVQANGMMGMAWQVPLVVGPGLAGLLVRLWGPDAPYFAALAATVGGLLCYAAVPDRRRDPPEAHAPALSELVVGFREGWRNPTLRTLFALAAAAWVLLGVVITLESLFVKDVLGREQDSLGVLWAASGVGALAASLVIARLRQGAGREPVLVAVGLAVAGAGYLLYVATSSYRLALAGSVILGGGFTFFMSPAQALIQRIAEEPGRVTGVFGTLSEGMPMVSSLTLAALGGLVDVQVWLVASAVGVLLVGAVALWTAGTSVGRTPRPTTVTQR